MNLKDVEIKTIALIITFSLGWILSWHFREPKKAEIIPGKVIYNTIPVPIHLTEAEARQELTCYDLMAPTLGIKQISDDKYELNASLCKREWHEEVSIKIRTPEYNNLIIAGVFYDSQLHPGFYTQYYRMFGRFGIGGGVNIALGYIAVNAGVAYKW